MGKADVTPCPVEFTEWDGVAVMGGGVNVKMTNENWETE